MNIQSGNTFSRLPLDHEVESRARAIFRDACEGTDSYHALRLGLGRRQALHTRPAHSGARFWVPVAGGAIACCALAIGLAVMRPFAINTPAPAATTVVASVGSSADGAVDLDSNPVELVENLDFYQWLAAQPGTAAAPRGSSK